jgi:hypothetical protein
MDEDHLFCSLHRNGGTCLPLKQVWAMLHAEVDRPAASGWNPAIEAHHPVLVLALSRGA